MSVTFKGLDGLRLSSDAEGVSEYHLTFKLYASSNLLTDTGSDILAALASNSISIGAAHPDTSAAKCKSIVPRCGKRVPLASGTVWEWSAEVTYTTKVDPKNPSNESNPTDRPAVIEIFTETSTGPATSCVDNSFGGTTVVNSAFDPLSREWNAARVVIRIEKNFSSFNSNYCREVGDGDGYVLSRNNATWTITDAVLGTFVVATGTGRIEELRVSKQYDQSGNAYAKVNAEIRVDVNEWADFCIDQGFFHWVVVGVGQEERRPFTDQATGAIRTTPGLLNGAGQRLADDADPVNIWFQYYQTKNWATLSLV